VNFLFPTGGALSEAEILNRTGSVHRREEIATSRLGILSDFGVPKIDRSAIEAR
jgi:hypothetical protein